MTIPDVADLVTIAARVLEIGTGEVLDLIDLPAAEAALSGSPAAAAIRPRWRLRC
jgi:hypothetical protein